MNTIDKEYQVRGKSVELKELVDWAAVPAAKGRPPAAPSPLPQAQAFADAGWSLVPRRLALDGAKVYLRPGGGLALGTNRLSVRVAGTHSEQEARDLLAAHGLGGLERLKFARNLFTATVPPGQDALDAAARLTASNDIDFAEPELVEVLSHR